MSKPLLAPLPLDETDRLRALRPYQLLNTLHDETFTELVRLTAKLFRVPVCIMALLEEEVMRFGLNYGLPPDLDRVDRDETLCSVALQTTGTTVFNDLHTSPCALINPALVQRLNLGFYAGHALRTADGHPIGVLCVIDHVPRAFSATDSALLESLTTVVMSLLELRAARTQQPRWNQDLWADVYRRIEGSVTRLESLAAHSTPADQLVNTDEIRHIIAILQNQIHAEQAR